ncbi:MAG: acyl-phosphate glycerol 3-phosphate acyltransferase, partial [Elusimicrobia bacterium]|nr:acyl-phosphate glycerol 3-phosphate acyltransferase [Elusimicrobiota bacterium]
ISVGSMLGALLLPLLALALHSPLPPTVMAFAVSALILAKHIPNLKRLLKGRELFFKHGPHLENREKKQ